MYELLFLLEKEVITHQECAGLCRYKTGGNLLSIELPRKAYKFI